MSTQAQRWQYPAKTQPIEPVALPVLDWLVQHPDGPGVHPPPSPHASRPSLATLVEFGVPAAPLADIDWLVQQPDPIRLPSSLPEQFAFTRLVEISEIPIDWLLQHPDPRRRPPELVGEQYASDPTTPLIELDWLVEPAIVTRPPLRVVPGESFFLRLVDIGEITIDWLLQHPDPVLPLPRPPTMPTLVEFGVPIPPAVPDTDFIVQHPDPLPLPPPINTEPELAFEHEDLVPVPDWLVQHPDPVLPPDRAPPGEQFLVEELVVPSSDWLVQHPDPVLPEPPRLGEYALGELVEIPIDSWLRPPSQPVLPIERRQDFYVRSEVVVPPPPVLLEWFVQYPDPQFITPPLIGELFVFDFAAPIGFVFVLRECLALWQMVDRRLWPSGAAPSGYFNIVEAAVPSGFVKSSEEPEKSTSLWNI